VVINYRVSEKVGESKLSMQLVNIFWVEYNFWILFLDVNNRQSEKTKSGKNYFFSFIGCSIFASGISFTHKYIVA